MNFIEYCIATKNYSTLKAVKDYSECRTFTEKMSGKTKAAIAAIAAGVPVATAAGLAAAYPEDAVKGVGKMKAGWDKVKDYFKGDEEDTDEVDDVADAIDEE